MTGVWAIEAADAEGFGREVGTGGGAGFVGTIGAVAVVVVDAGEGDSDGWVGETGEGVGDAVVIQFSIYRRSEMDGRVGGGWCKLPSGETPRGAVLAAANTSEVMRRRRVLACIFCGPEMRVLGDQLG